MKFRTGRLFWQAVILLGLSVPSFAQQTVAPPPARPTLPQPSLGTDPMVNEPQSTLPPVAVPAPAPAPKVAKRKGPVDSLKPGQFVWEKRETYEGSMKIVAVLDIQRLYVFQNDELIGFTTISSGKKGKETPTGVFNILQKNIDHKSNLYSNAPMPFMQRLTWDGIAMHGGHLPGYPASHGCIRLPHAFAKALYGVTQMDQEVVVLKDIATPVKRPEPKPVPVVEPPVVAPPAVVDPSVVPEASPPKPVAGQPI
jgi:lipoprotein-anchoring transpeptidase ErfK/SrfK